MTPRRLAVAAATVVWLAAALGAAQPEPGRKMPDRGHDHIADGTRGTYDSYPPTSGPHWRQWAPWGMHAQPVADELFVHNLEHGGVVLLYKCASPCPDVVRQLETTLRALPRSKYGHVKVVVSPNARIRTRFALLAWTRLDEFDTFDRARIERFVRAYQDKGPEDVP